MMQVWFLFKILESIVGAVCMTYHTHGFLDKEPLPHILLFCGTFFGFTLLAFVGAIAIAISNAPSPLIESVTNFCASLMYFTASVVSLQFAEKDQHLMYLSDFEEPTHEFFSFCRAQSVTALLAGAIHLLHTILAFDALLDARSTAELNEFIEDSDSELDWEATTHLRLYFLGKYVEKKLRANTWFDNMCQRKNPPISIFSGVRKYREASLGQEEYRRKSVYVKPIDKIRRMSQLTMSDKAQHDRHMRFQLSSADLERSEYGSKLSGSKKSDISFEDEARPVERSSSQIEVPMGKLEYGHPSVRKKKFDVIPEEPGSRATSEHGILKKAESTADKKSSDDVILKLKDEKPSTSKMVKSDVDLSAEMIKEEQTKAEGKYVDEAVSTYVTPSASSTLGQRGIEDKKGKDAKDEEDQEPKDKEKKDEDQTDEYKMEDQKEKDSKEDDKKDKDQKDKDQKDKDQKDKDQKDKDQKDKDQKDNDSKEKDSKDERSPPASPPPPPPPPPPSPSV